MLTLERLRKVISLAQIKFGNSTSRSSLFAAMLIKEEIEVTWVLTLVNLGLLLMSRVATVSRLIPSRFLKKVLVMTTLFAELMIDGKVSSPNLPRAVHLMSPTDVSLLKVRVDNCSMPFSSKVPPMLSREVDPIENNLVALAALKLPVIDRGPFKEMVLAASEPMSTSPLMLVQVA